MVFALILIKQRLFAAWVSFQGRYTSYIDASVWNFIYKRVGGTAKSPISALCSLNSPMSGKGNTIPSGHGR